jgi:NTE family protein
MIATESHFDKRTQEIIERYFDIPASKQNELGESLQQIRLEGGEWLFHQGEVADSFYILLRGRLQVWLESRNKQRLEEPELIGRVTPGESVGELALLSRSTRSAGIRAVRDSTLIRISRTSFQQLTLQHPPLLMKLAERAASLAQKSPQAGAGSTHNLSTISILPLDDSAEQQEFCRQLASNFSRHGTVRWLDRDSLVESGSPVTELPTSGLMPESLVNWVQHLEDTTRLLLFQCEPAATQWTRFCLRQSDLVVLVATASQEPACRQWERQLGLHESDGTARRMLVLLQPGAADEISHTSRWFQGRQLDFHLHARDGNQRDIERISRVLLGEATGLVLGAGASRGFAHLGVIKALEAAGKPIDFIGGSSIGAIMATPTAMGLTADQGIRLMRKAFLRGKPFSDFTLPLVSLLSGGRMQRLLREHADVQIEDLPIPFFCISSNLDDGSINVHQSGSMARALQATASMPGILPPTVVNGRLAVDGAVLNGLPVDVMWQQAVGEVIAVSLAAHGTMEVDYTDTPSAWAVLRNRWLPFTRPYRVPAMMTVVLKATELATMNIVRLQGERASLLIQPDVRRFALTEVRAFDDILQSGYAAAEETLHHRATAARDL